MGEREKRIGRKRPSAGKNSSFGKEEKVSFLSIRGNGGIKNGTWRR